MTMKIAIVGGGAAEFGASSWTRVAAALAPSDTARPSLGAVSRTCPATVFALDVAARAPVWAPAATVFAPVFAAWATSGATSLALAAALRT